MTEAETKSIAVCNGERAEEVAEAYLLGTLSIFEMERFEEHYFECPACFAHLQALQSAQQELISRPSPMALSPTRLRRRLLALGAIAAAVAAGFVSFHRMTEHPAHSSPAAVAQMAAPATTASSVKENPPVNIASLADLSLPPYMASSVRGGEVEGAFQAGMHAYTAGDCSGALPQLKSVPEKDENAVAARLYAGACELSAREKTVAARDFEKVIAAGDSPQFEAAYYYLAQAALLDGKAQVAKKYLAKTIVLRGDFEQRASAQLARLTN